MHTDPVCPACGSKNVVRILYGLPTEESLELARSGKVLLHSRCTTADEKDWACRTCMHEWGDSRAAHVGD